MSYFIAIDLSDKSYYTDWLERITDKPRKYWSRFSLFQLRFILRKELKRLTGGVS